jgi:hypothetical protein
MRKILKGNISLIAGLSMISFTFFLLGAKSQEPGAKNFFLFFGVLCRFSDFLIFWVLLAV